VHICFVFVISVNIERTRCQQKDSPDVSTLIHIVAVKSWGKVENLGFNGTKGHFYVTFYDDIWNNSTDHVCTSQL